MGDLLMIGVSSSTHRIGDTVIKVPSLDDELLITEQNIRAAKNEANCYRILGRHPRIAECLYVSSTSGLVALKFCPHGNVKDFLAKKPSFARERSKWSRQMVESVVYIHRKGIRHSDLRLDQWLVDDNLNIRLGDFNAAGHDGYERLNISPCTNTGLEASTHFMPRDPVKTSTVQSDLFALGSSLYELEKGDVPFAGEDLGTEEIEERFRCGQFPQTVDLSLGPVILGCWEKKYASAAEILGVLERLDGADPEETHLSPFSTLSTG